MSLADQFTNDMNTALMWWDTTKLTEGMGDRSRIYFATEYGMMRQYGDHQYNHESFGLEPYFQRLKADGRIV